MASGENHRSDSEAKDPLIGRVLSDRFEIKHLICKGGVGAVYLAMQAPFNRPCALKVLRPRYQTDDSLQFQRRFFLEASTAAKLRHPNNVAVFDYGRTEDDIYFMAMEYLEGITLRQAIRREAPFDEARTIHIASQLCRALREAHHHGVIHRDIKPANVILLDRHDEKDFVKVLDFGLVKDVRGDTIEDLTQAGLFMGSPKYVAPEQIHGAPVDARTDIYSVGVVMYEMVTGRVPFDGGATVPTLIAHVKDRVPPLRQMNPACNVTLRLEEVIYRCIAKAPADRFASMDDLLVELKKNPIVTMGSATLTDSGGRLVESDALRALSSSAPQPTTVTAPNRVISKTNGTEADHEGAGAKDSWTRKYGRNALATVAVIAAVVATVFTTGRAVPQPVVESTIRSSFAGVNVTSAPPLIANSVVIAPGTQEAKPAERFVTLSTTPARAKVLTTGGEELCKKSPCRIPARRFDGGLLTVKISAPGCGIAIAQISIDEDEVSIRLPRARRGAGGRGDTVSAPTGYKPNPFGPNPFGTMPSY